MGFTVIHGATLVGGAITILKNMKVNAKIIPSVMEHKKCLKPPTRTIYCNGRDFS
jgi:hypothetical protein